MTRERDFAAALHEAGLGCMQPIAASRNVCGPNSPNQLIFEEMHVPLAARILSILPAERIDGERYAHAYYNVARMRPPLDLLLPPWEDLPAEMRARAIADGDLIVREYEALGGTVGGNQDGDRGDEP